MRTRLIDLEPPESAVEWQQYSRLKLPYVFAPTQASYKLDEYVLGACARKTYYEQCRCLRDSLSNKAYSIFDFGLAFEARQIDIFKIAGIYVADHVPISFFDASRGIYVSGEVDSIVRIDGELVGVEFKTGYGYKFLQDQILGRNRKYKDSRPYLQDETAPCPKPEHLLQVACYLYYFTYRAQPPVPKIREWRIVYQDRGTCSMAEYVASLQDVAGFHVLRVWKLERDGEYEVPLRQITVQGILDRYKYVYDCIIRGALPNRDFDPTAEGDDATWQCAYCLFKSSCVRNELGESVSV